MGGYLTALSIGTPAPQSRVVPQVAGPGGRSWPTVMLRPHHRRFSTPFTVPEDGFYLQYVKEDDEEFQESSLVLHRHRLTLENLTGLGQLPPPGPGSSSAAPQPQRLRVPSHHLRARSLTPSKRPHHQPSKQRRSLLRPSSMSAVGMAP